MNSKFIFYVTIIMAVAFFSATAGAAEQELLTPPFGFSDKDSDGVNDLFRDADGNGTDDVTGKAYRHSFQYRDNDNDGKNDLFQDANGDGVNDKFIPGTHSGRRGIIYSLDADKDGRNDVTGSSVPSKGFGRHSGNGQWDDFLDEDGDGIDDRRGWGNRWRKRHGKEGDRKDKEDKNSKGKDEEKDKPDNNGKGKGKNNSVRHQHH